MAYGTLSRQVAGEDDSLDVMKNEIQTMQRAITQLADMIQPRRVEHEMEDAGSVHQRIEMVRDPPRLSAK